MSVDQIVLPSYSRGQEATNSITHALGILFALVGGPFLILRCVEQGHWWNIATAIVFLLSILCLYGVSALYHGLPEGRAKKVFRVLDHNMVFLLIWGTYTPYCLSGMAPEFPGWGWSIWGVVTFLGVAGAILNTLDIHKFAKLCMVDYLLMGWTAIVSFYPLIISIGWFPGTFLLLMGGVAYTIGAALYGLGGKRSKWWHSVWHVAVLLGTLLMFLSLYFSVL